MAHQKKSNPGTVGQHVEFKAKRPAKKGSAARIKASVEGIPEVLGQEVLGHLLAKYPSLQGDLGGLAQEVDIYLEECLRRPAVTLGILGRHMRPEMKVELIGYGLLQMLVRSPQWKSLREDPKKLWASECLLLDVQREFGIGSQLESPFKHTDSNEEIGELIAAMFGKDISGTRRKPQPSVAFDMGALASAALDMEVLATTLLKTKARWQSVGLAVAADTTGLAQGYVPPPDPVTAGEIDPLDAPLLHYEGDGSPGEPVLRAREIRAALNAREFRILAAKEPAAQPKEPAPTRWDWREVMGKSWITLPKAQGDCGSCVAFAVAGAMEAMCLIQGQKVVKEVDLSEAHLFYCHAAAEQRTCDTGWYISAALKAAEKEGVVDEASFPYTAGDQACQVGAGTATKLTRVKGWAPCSTHAEMKLWLRETGPLVTAMTVYADFQMYKSGIYQHVMGADLGGHAVLCVGYDDEEQCWIAKNSWRGTKWGEAGFFRIAYGACGFDARMWGLKAVEGFLA